jgi:hypothetical protein
MWRSHENTHDKTKTWQTRGLKNTTLKSLEIPGCPKQFLLTVRPLRRHDPGPSHPWPEASSMSKSREATMDVFFWIEWGYTGEASMNVLGCSMVFYDVLWCSMSFPRNIVNWISCCDICDNVFVRVEFWWPKRGSAVSGCERPNKLWVKILER